MKVKTIGYIASNDAVGYPGYLCNKSNCIWKDVPKSGVLFNHESKITIFPSRALANAAVRRSVAYFAVHSGRKNADKEDYTVMRLCPPTC